MAEVQDLKLLLERVEKAEGPDRELDRDLAVALDVHGHAAKGAVDRPVAWGPDVIVYWPDRSAWQWTPENYTASIDAALALVERVLPGVMWQVGFDPDDGSMCARLVTVPPPCRHVKANHDTPALALCAALLKTLIHQGSKEHVG